MQGRLVHTSTAVHMLLVQASCCALMTSNTSSGLVSLRVSSESSCTQVRLVQPLPFPRHPDQSIQPVLMTQQHLIRLHSRQLRSRLANLALLRQNPDSPAFKILHEPGMVDFNFRVCISVQFRGPRYATCTVWGRRRGFFHRAGQNGEAEGAEFELVAFVQFRAGRGRCDV